jgi:hypothetical protein
MGRVGAWPPEGGWSRYPLSADLRFAARSGRDEELVRLRDGRVLHLLSFHSGRLQRVVYDDAGLFDADPEALERLRFRGVETGGVWVAMNPALARHLRHGLLRELVAP